MKAPSVRNLRSTRIQPTQHAPGMLPAGVAAPEEKSEQAIWPAALMQMFSGRELELPGFTGRDIDLYGDVAESLARLCRFGGHVQGNVYSVAQHSVIGADAAYEETGDPQLAGYFLVNDAHEFVLGDWTNPMQRWLQHMEQAFFGTAHVVRSVLQGARAQLDAAIFHAAGLPPIGMTHRRRVHEYDVRLLATERRQLLVPTPTSWGPEVDAAKPIRLRGKLVAWSTGHAVQEFRDRLDKFCPNARRL